MAHDNWLNNRKIWQRDYWRSELGNKHQHADFLGMMGSIATVPLMIWFI